MRAWSALLLTVALQVAQPQGEPITLTINKCCGPFQMLSGDGSTCVNATWPRNDTLRQRYLRHVVLQPGDAPWVDLWLPPGLPFHRVGEVYLGSLRSLKLTFGQLKMWPVEASVEWDEGEAEAMGAEYFSRRVIFSKTHGRVTGPEPRPASVDLDFGLGVYWALGEHCVDATQPPLAPFALIAEPDCHVDACVLKCCRRRDVVRAVDGGRWGCGADRRAAGWLRNSSFAPLLRKTTIDNRRRRESCVQRPSVTTLPLRLPPDDELAAHLLQRRYHDFMWSTWDTCVDFELLSNGTLRDTIFYCPESRITRGAYWLLRHLCFISVSLLVVALSSVACNSGMRLKTHGWCLACYTSCLLGFNVGQVAYYMTISDQVDAFGFVPPHLRNTCKTFAFPMYFLLMAANCWLTALCFNLALGFRKLQMVRPGGGKDWKRFLVLSAFAWGLPALVTGLCAYAYEKDEGKRRWFNPTLTETRTCFHELMRVKAIVQFTELSLVFSSFPSGTALFYYGPVCLLITANVLCIVSALRKVQFLRRGNSVLHREEDKVAQSPRKTDGENPRGGSTRTSKAARSTVADAKTIKLFVKMVLMTGIIDVVAEIIGWATIPSQWSPKMYAFGRKEELFVLEHKLAYRATGYATDCFRAACVVWLAAPDGGYFGALRGWLGATKRD